MSYLTAFEHEYVIGDLDIYREFDISSYIMTAKSAITRTTQTLSTNIKFDFYPKMVEKALRSFNNLKVDKPQLVEFIAKYNEVDVDVLGLQARAITKSDVLDIRPQYLTQYVTNIALTIDRVIKNTIEKDEVDRYISSDVTTRVKKQMVKTNGLPHEYSAKELTKIRNTQTVDVTSDYIEGQIVPFIKSFDDISKKINDECASVISSLTSTGNDLEAYIKAFNKIKREGKLSDKTSRKLDYLMFNAIRGLLDAASFLAYMTIRKINTLGSNIIACQEVYNKILSTTTLDAVTEDVFDSILIPDDTNSLSEGLISGRADAYITISQNIYDYNKGQIGTCDSSLGDKFNSVVDAKVDDIPYNKTQYDEAGKMYIIISQGLDIISANSDDYLLVFDDLVEKSGFSLRLEDRFRSKLESLDDISEYTSAANISTPGGDMSDLYVRMMSEVKDYPENMETLAKIILDCKTKMDMLKERFENNINGEFENAQAVNELKIFLEDLKEQYRVMTNTVAAKFMLRLKNIGLCMEKINASQNSSLGEEDKVDDEIINFNESVYDILIEEHEAVTDAIFESLTLEYVIARQRKERGVNIILEDGEETKNTNASTTQQQTQTQSKTTPVQKEQKPNETKQQNQTQSKPANDQKVENSDGKKGEATIKAMVDKVNKWFEQIMEKIKSLSESAQAKADAQYFSQYKGELLSKNYANRRNKTPIIEYEKLIPRQRLTTDLKSLVNKTSGANLTPQKIQSCEDDAALIRVIFGNNPPQSVWESENVPQAITSYYKCGTYAENRVTVKSGELKKMVMDAIEYCEPFYTKTLPQMRSSIEAIKNNLNTSLETLVKENSLDDIFGMLFTEADGDDTTAKNTVTSMASKCNTIEKLVQQYCNAMLTAAFDRYKDYMGLLRGVVNGPKPEEETTTGNTETEQK